MKRCTACGNRYNDEMRFCVEDQTALVDAARHDQQADTLQIQGADDSWIKEIPFPDAPGIVTMGMSPTTVILGIYVQPAPPDNQPRPFLCVRVKDRQRASRRFLLAGGRDWVRGEYVGSFLSSHGYLIHVFEIEPEDAKRST